MIAAQSHKALRILLLIFAILAAIGGLVTLFGSTYVASLGVMHLNFAPYGLVPMLLKFVGIVALALAYLMYVTSKDPIRYVAVIDAFAFLLIAAACIDLYALVVWHAAPFYPAAFVIARAIVRVTLAVVLIALRPREGSLA